LLNMMLHHVSGSAPHVCLWETGPERCASLPASPAAATWSVFRAAVNVDAGTKALTLYLYADGGVQEALTINEYARISAVEVSALYSFALLADPDHRPTSPIKLVVLHDSYSTEWRSPSGEHVLVDGMLNGWLVTSGSSEFSVTYAPTVAFRAAGWTSLLALVLIAAFCARGLIARILIVQIANAGSRRYR
jgi:arabinofuranan 3-O-arabinosyltransferase